MRQIAAAFLLVLAVALTVYAGAGADVDPSSFESAPYLPRSHSHNDYARRIPLFEALKRGFASVEVDVFLVDGALFVAHELDEVRPTATLSGLYLDPLRDAIRKNGGSVYARTDEPLQLLIDVKSEADDTYRALHETLRAYSDILTVWTRDGPRPGPVRAVLSGNRALTTVAAQAPRYVAIDGRIGEDRSSWTVDLMPLVSANWEELGPTPEVRQAAARALADRLHAEGRKVRFWGTPEREVAWRSLLAMGVDYIGTDRVEDLDGWLRLRGKETPEGPAPERSLGIDVSSP